MNRATNINNTIPPSSIGGNIGGSGNNGGMTNQSTYASGNIGGVGTNGNNGLNSGNGINCNTNANINGQQQMIINDINEQYDHNGIVDVTVNSLLLNTGPDKYLYTPGFGGWDNDQIYLSDEFKQHYELWLEQEVYNINIDWDSLKTVYDIMPEGSKTTPENRVATKECECE